MYEYIVTKPSRLDSIVYKFYKDEHKINEVLECNPHLVSKLILEVGEIVKLPILKKDTTIKKDVYFISYKYSQTPINPICSYLL